MYDVVYVLKKGPKTEELFYSIRSVVENFPYNRICIFGSVPTGIVADYSVTHSQTGRNKYERTDSTLKKIMSDDNLTEDIWIFNDDFFILQPWTIYANQTDGHLPDLIRKIEQKFGKGGPYTDKLLHTNMELLDRGYDNKNFETHTPMLVNRAKARELYSLRDTFKISAFRSGYGNFFNVDSFDAPDRKITDLISIPSPEDKVVSTLDRSFTNGAVGKYLKERFPNPTKYEKR